MLSFIPCLLGLLQAVTVSAFLAPQSTWTVRHPRPSLLLQNANYNDDDQVAGAFNQLNEDMQKNDEKTLESLKELSESFKKLAQSDTSNLFATTSPPAVEQSVSHSEQSGPVIGAGGMADTRDPDAFYHDDPRKSIGAAPSFEEYLKQRDTGTFVSEPAAPPQPAAPAALPQPAAPTPADDRGQIFPAVATGGDVATTNEAEKILSQMIPVDKDWNMNKSKGKPSTPPPPDKLPEMPVDKNW